MAGNGNSGIVIKRSVSPDGRIDSLSVEVDFPAESLSASDLKTRAENVIRLQDEIVASFLNGAKVENGKGEGPFSDAQDDGSIPAEIVRVGGMDGKWGRRLFLSVRSEDRMLRLFGNRRQLVDYLKNVGRTETEARIAEGLELSIPCRIVTRPSDDGRFINIDRILPARGNGTRVSER